jgi:phosphatidylcholine synthase
MVASDALTSSVWAALPVLASAYGFSQAQAKTDDDFFLGFPSYWNVVAIYAWLLEVPAPVTTAVVMLLALLVFVPVKYLYPSRMVVLRWTTICAAALWMFVLFLCLLETEGAARLKLPHLSLLFPLYYIVLSLWLGGLERRGE